MSHLDVTLTANLFGRYELSREQLQTIQDADREYKTELGKLRAENKALLDALKEARPYIRGGQEVESVLFNVDAAIEHSEPQ